MRADVRAYRDEYWPALRALLAEHWRTDLPLLDRRLFDWQYRGYGPLSADRSGQHASRVVFLRDQLVGFYGAIPGLYRLPGRADPTPGLAMALWLVRRDLRNAGLGIFLLRGIESLCPLTLTLGANADTIRYLTAHSYRLLPATHRFVAPLQVDGYLALCSQSPPGGAVDAWQRSLATDQAAADLPATGPIDPDALADRWRRLAPDDCLTLERSADFYRWRYADSAGFAYAAAIGPGDSFAIVRIEKTIDAADGARDGLAVLRIIELWPDPAHGPVQFVGRLLAWGQRMGACAADFQCSNRRLAEVLAAAGLRSQSPDYGPAECSLAGLFQPVRPTAAPINALWRVEGQLAPAPPAESTWLLKSDGDMDRPNLWPAERLADA